MSGKTVRVRIAVAVNARGSAGCVGYEKDGVCDAKVQLEALDGIDLSRQSEPIRYSWIEADVPVPEEVTVEGEVSDA